MIKKIRDYHQAMPIPIRIKLVYLLTKVRVRLYLSAFLLLFLVGCASTSTVGCHAEMNEHWKRLGWTIQGKWDTEYDPGRKSDLKPFPFEITHASKNVSTEWLRAHDYYYRKGKQCSDDYEWPK